MRKCSRCKEIKSDDFFYNSKNKSYCKECIKEKSKEYRDKNKKNKKVDEECSPYVSNMILNLNYGLVEYAFEEWQVNELKRRYKKEIEIVYNGFNYEIRRVQKM